MTRAAVRTSADKSRPAKKTAKPAGKSMKSSGSAVHTETATAKEPAAAKDSAGTKGSTAEPDLARALKTVIEFMGVPGKSGEEGRIMELVKQRLIKAGASKSDLVHDNTNRHSPIGGEVGNLILKLPGTVKGPRRLLMAHVDTVPLCVGSKPVRKGDVIVSANKETALGADDRAGACAILEAAESILRSKLPHPPVTFMWLVQEEIGLHGARHGQLNKLGNPQLCFNWDGSVAEKVTLGATGAYKLDIVVSGIASHAGVAPERGASAIAIASLAIAQLQRDGWHGDINRDGFHGTSNVGIFNGGAATNVVTDRVTIRTEARSHDPGFRVKIVEAFEKAFHDAAQQVRTVDGRTGSVEISRHLEYESFALAETEPCVQVAESVIRSLGLEPMRVISNGGLDANWTSARGLPTVTMGCGQREPHTVNEHLKIRDFEMACRIALRLATGANG